MYDHTVKGQKYLQGMSDIARKHRMDMYSLQTIKHVLYSL